MSSNRYDSPAQYNPIDTYVPIPFAEISAAAQYRQKKLEGMEDRMDMAAEQAKQLKYISGSEDEKYIKNVISNIDKISTKYMGQDLSNPIIARQLKQEMRSGVDSNRVNDIQDSYVNWMQNEKVNAKLKAEGNYREELDENPAIGYDTSKKGVFNYQTAGFENFRPTGEQYFNNIEDSILTNAKGQMLTTGRGYNLSGIDEAKIREVSSNNVASALDTNAGKQAVKLAKNRHPEYAEFNDEQIMEELLFGIGKERINTKLTGSAYPIDRNRGDKNDPNIFDNQKNHITTVKTGNNQTYSKDWMTLKTKGNFGHDWETDNPTYQLLREDDSKDKEKIKKYEELKKNLENEKKKYGISNMPNDKATDLLNKAVEGLNNMSLPSIVISEDESRIILNGVSPTSEIFVIGNEKGYSNDGKPSTMEGVSKELGLTYDEIKGQLNDTRSIQFTNYGPLPGMYVVPLVDKNNKPHNVFISSGDQIQNMSRLSNTMFNKFVNIDNKPFADDIGSKIEITEKGKKVEKELHYKINHKLNKTLGSFDPDVEYGYMDGDRFISKGKTSIAQIAEREQYEIKNSNLLGTQWNFLQGRKAQSSLSDRQRAWLKMLPEEE